MSNSNYSIGSQR